MSERAFTVDVLDSAGNVLGQGPVASVLAVEIEQALDEAGKVSVSAPATDPNALDLLAVERRLRVRTMNGFLITSIIRSKATSPGDAPTFTVSGPDLLDELTRLSCGRALIYDNVAVSTVIPDLLSGFSPAWSATVDAGLGNITCRFDGDTRLGAIQAIRQRLGKHFRRGMVDRTIEFGAFGATKAYRLMNVDAFRVAQESNAGLLLLDTLEVVEDSWSVVNRILPYGAGDGEGQLDLRYCSAARAAYVKTRAGKNRGDDAEGNGTAGATTLTVADATGFAAGDPLFIGDATDLSADHEINQVASVGVGSLTLRGPLQHSYTDQAALAWPEFYIEDASSQSTYDVVERPLAWKEIAPLTNSDADMAAASDALYDVAYAYLQVYKAALTVYRATVLNPPDFDDLFVGDKLYLCYKGAVTRDGVAYSYLDVQNQLFWLLRVKLSLRADGSRLASFDIANLDRPAGGDVDATISAIATGEVWKSYTQAYPCRFENTRYEEMDGSAVPGGPHDVIVPVDIDDSVLYLNKARLRFRTRPLRATATGAGGGGGVEQSTEAGGAVDTTSADGGSVNQSSASGGASNPTSTQSGAHRHTMFYFDEKGGPTNWYRFVAVKESGGYCSPEIAMEDADFEDHIQTYEEAADHQHDVSIADHTHTITIAAHTHQVTQAAHTHLVDIDEHTHSLVYGIHDDDKYPDTVRLAINGVDVTTALGGPWGAGGVAIDEEVDITMYLRNASGGLRQVHELTFSCDDGQGTVESIVKLTMTVQSVVVN